MTLAESYAKKTLTGRGVFLRHRSVRWNSLFNFTYLSLLETLFDRSTSREYDDAD